MEDLVVRPYHVSDANLIMEIDRLTWSSNNSPGSEPSDNLDEYLQQLQRRNILVAVMNSQVCGYIGIGSPTLLPTNSHVAVLDVAVHPQFQRRGVATALFKAVEDWCSANSKRKLVIRVLATNPGAGAFYRKLGYVEEGRLRGEFQIAGRFVDDILMAKWLI